MDRWEEGFDNWTPSQQLAREIASTRRDGAAMELEALQRSLRESATAVAARDLELARLRRALEEAHVPGKERELEAALARAQAERALAVAERERLEEREQAARSVERELAAKRIELEAREAALAVREAAQRRRELTDAPSFSDGLAELTRTHLND
jgi:hypothetical protein